MTVRESLDLSAFAPAVEQLAAQIDNVGSDEKLIADAAVAVCSGIVAMAVFQSAPAGPPVGNWEGALDDHSLCLFSTKHQLVFTLKNNMFQSAVLSGPSGNTWNVIRSEHGLHVQVANSSAEIVKDRLIKNDGSIVDTADASTAMEKLKSELQRIASIPENSLPDYVPAGDLIDVDAVDDSSLFMFYLYQMLTALCQMATKALGHMAGAHPVRVALHLVRHLLTSGLFPSRKTFLAPVPVLPAKQPMLPETC